MVSLYFVRHGQTDNIDQVVYGRLGGFRLSAAGKEQAEKVGKYLVDKNITHIFTSPIERTVQTAEIIAEALNGVPVEKNEDLTEVDSSAWEGLTWPEAVKNESYEKFHNDPDASGIAENLSQIASRMEKTAKTLLENYPSQNLVCVSHEDPILSLKLKLEEKPLATIKSYDLTFGEIIRFDFDPEGGFVRAENIKP